MSDAPFSADVYAARREALRARMTQAGHSALLVSQAANRYYLSGFELHDGQCNESSGMLLVTRRGRDILLTDPRFFDAARRLWPEEDIFIYSGPRFAQMRRFLGDVHPGPMAFEARGLCYEAHALLGQGLALTPTSDLVEALRRIKEPAEIERLDRSFALNQKVMETAPDILKPGLTEAQAAWKLERLFRDLGASELCFAPIVAVDQNAALPHAVPGDTLITEECCVLVDMGARLGDYCSDQTRTFWVGSRPTDHFRAALERTQAAQRQAMAILRPGLPATEAYAAARKCYEGFGVAQAFTHALGHGVGLETHEAPSLSPLSDAVLEPGMVVTVEPGLYYPEWGGVRWEHTVVITEDGCRVLCQGDA